VSARRDVFFEHAAHDVWVQAQGGIAACHEAHLASRFRLYVCQRNGQGSFYD